MLQIKRKDTPVQVKKGRTTYRIFGASNALVHTDDIQGAYATFSFKQGSMETHCHENEYMYVIDAKDAYVSFGMDAHNLTGKHILAKGDILRPHEGEWHRFDYTSEDGFVDFINLFAVAQSHVKTAE